MRINYYATETAAAAAADVINQFWDHFGIILGSSWDHFGIILGSFLDHFGIILGSVWDHFEVCSGSFWDHFGAIWKMPRERNSEFDIFIFGRGTNYVALRKQKQRNIKD